MIERVAIAGAGAFGTALALVAHKAGRQVTLWSRSPEKAQAIVGDGQNADNLHGVEIPDTINVSADPDCFAQAELVVFAVPAQATRQAAARLADAIPAGIPLLAAGKGIEQQTGLRQTEVLAAELPGRTPAALSGPGFAEEIARDLPTAMTIAAAEIDVAHKLAAALASPAFRPYASDDVIGVELGGAVKNVLAIACGVVAGRALGESARAALISRGLAEMTRLGTALGARSETFMGLSGLGDLVLTATGRRSRNLAFGMALGEGLPPTSLLAEGMPLAEGAHTAEIAGTLAANRHVDAPIITAVAAILAGSLSVDAAIEGLVSRPLKAENA